MVEDYKSFCVLDELLRDIVLEREVTDGNILTFYIWRLFAVRACNVLCAITEKPPS